MLESYVDVIERFREIPDVLCFEEMLLQSLAALHPPTYVHSVMVGQLTKCMCIHLIRLKPQLLVGVLRTKTVWEVQERKDEIADFAYHAALCHDAGKIAIIDTIFVYGRKLTEMEFALIKTHPETGYELLSRYASTREYADVALGHHKWYDNSGGYPEDFDTSKSSAKTIIDLVQCADCMDAATDNIGRSYNKGKTLNEFLTELSEGAGNRYAPWLVELFADKTAFDEIELLLTKGRRHNYRRTYYLLRNMQEQTVYF
ncbi:MAG: HD domain-containing protein [Lachnospiraceae bacterium]|jgi:HD-GYP domain-containing protein (c-di-GMP phosphodiesterase class II)|nr:HD domain-containing protein [Lachnospiraceae bacterium]